MNSSIIRKTLSCVLVLSLVAACASLSLAQGSPVPEDVSLTSETAVWCDGCQKDTEHNELGECIDAGHPLPAPPVEEGSENPGSTEGTEPEGNNGASEPAPAETPSDQDAGAAAEEEADTRSFPSAYPYIPNAPYLPAHYTQDHTTEKLITSLAEQARQTGQKHDFYASILIAQAVLAGGYEDSILAEDPNTLASAYSGALKESTDTYEDAARFLQVRNGEDDDYAARLIEVIETYELGRYDEPLGYEIVGQLYDRELKNEKDEVVGGMRALTMDDYVKLETVSTSLMDLKYVWGGTSPVSGFDCSGFVQYCYREALGIALPRTTYTQQHLGTEIPFDQLQMGDLLFFDDRGDVNHVGMYLGNGYYIHSTSPGGVQITAMEDLTPAFAKRIAVFESVTVAGAGISNDDPAMGAGSPMTITTSALI